MKESELSVLPNNIAGDLSVILWSTELAIQELDPASDAYVHLARIRHRVHKSAARLRDVQENGVMAAGPVSMEAEQEVCLACGRPLHSCRVKTCTCIEVTPRTYKPHHGIPLPCLRVVEVTVTGR